MKHKQTNTDELKRIFDTKRILLAVAMMLVLPALILCQTNGKNANKKGGDEQAVRQALNELVAALGNNDAAGLDRIWADGYVFIGSTGVLTTKAQRLAALKSGEFKYESISFDDLNIHLFGDTAVATFIVTSKFQSNGQSSSGKYKTIGTFVKRKGRWTEIAAQLTPIGE